MTTPKIRAFSRRFDASLGVLRSAAPVPVFLRTVAGVATFAAAVVALPTAVLDLGPVAACLIPALIVAVAPRTRWVTAILFGCVGAWIVAGVAYGDPASPLRIGTLAASLYIAHVAAAFAAVLPVDCLVAPGVVARWARRHGLVLVAGLVVGLGGMAAAGLVPITPTLIGPVLGAALAAAVAAVLARSRR